MLAFEDDIEYELVGRDVDSTAMDSAWANPVNRLFVLMGFAGVGKSRFAVHWLQKCVLKKYENITLIFIDFKNFSFTQRKQIKKFWTKMCKEAKIKVESDDDDTVLQEDLEYAEQFREALYNTGKTFVFLFDSVDIVLNSDMSKFFTSLLSLLIKTDHVRTLITTTIKTKFAKLRKGVYYHNIKPLSLPDSEELLLTVAEDTFDFGRYLEPIALLCEGLPLALIGTADQLLSSDGLLEAREMVEILMANRIQALKMELYPKEDQLPARYQDKLDEKVYQSFKDRLSHLSSIRKTFSSSDAKETLQHHGSESSEAMVKHETLLPLLDMSTLTKADGEEKIMQVHDGVLRDYLRLCAVGKAGEGEGEDSVLFDMLHECLELVNPKHCISKVALREITRQTEGLQRWIQAIFADEKEDDESADSDDENDHQPMAIQQEPPKTKTEAYSSHQHPEGEESVRAETSSLVSSGPRDIPVQQTTDDRYQTYMATKEIDSSLELSGRPDGAFSFVMNPQPEHTSSGANRSHKKVAKTSSIEVIADELRMSGGQTRDTGHTHVTPHDAGTLHMDQHEAEYLAYATKKLSENKMDNPKNEKEESLRNSYDRRKMENLQSETSELKD